MSQPNKDQQPIVTSQQEDEDEDKKLSVQKDITSDEDDESDSKGSMGLLRLNSLSDKHQQKLLRLTEQQLEKVKILSIASDKSTQAFKRINKNFK
jgi:hypothetical protein